MDVKSLTQQPQVHIQQQEFLEYRMTVTGAVSYSCVSTQFQSHWSWKIGNLSYLQLEQLLDL